MIVVKIELKIINASFVTDSERPKFWVSGSAINLESSQVHAVGLSCVLIDLNHSEGRVALSIMLVVYSPSSRLTRVANSLESLLSVQMSISGIKCLPLLEIIAGFEPPAGHDRPAIDLHSCEVA